MSLALGRVRGDSVEKQVHQKPALQMVSLSPEHTAWLVLGG